MPEHQRDCTVQLHAGKSREATGRREAARKLKITCAGADDSIFHLKTNLPPVMNLAGCPRGRNFDYRKHVYAKAGMVGWAHIQPGLIGIGSEWANMEMRKYTFGRKITSPRPGWVL